MLAASYESFYGLAERPFSLTPDPRYFFKSRSHGRALESLMFGLRRRETFLLLTGDLGVGKTTTCRTLAEQWRRRAPVAYLPNPLLSPVELLRLLLQDFGVDSSLPTHTPQSGSAQELFDALVTFLTSPDRVKSGPVLIVDEAHNTPSSLMEELTRLTTVPVNDERALQVIMASQPWEGDATPAGIRAVESNIATRVRLLPFGREDCAAYVTHRLAVAGNTSVTFTPRAIDVLFGLSGGVPRLVNLLCERALHEGAAHHMRRIEPVAVETAASSLELLRARPRRFRWFHRRVS